MVLNLFVMALAGAAGTLARFGGIRLAAALGASFPWGTLGVNVLGSLAFGMIWAWTVGRPESDQTRLWALTGFMGAFTTFSTFAFETWKLLERSPGLAAANLAANNVLGIGALVLGLWLGSALTR